jgi:hypothetical protein
MLHLHQEPFNQANISSRNTQDRSYRFLVREIIGMCLDAMTPPLPQKITRLLVRQRLDLLSKANPRIGPALRKKPCSRKVDKCGTVL